MKIYNEMKLIFRSESCNESFARTAVCAFLVHLDPTITEISDIRTAVSEAVTNCIVHAYKQNPGNIELYVRTYDDRTVYIRVRDRGVGIANIAQAMEPMYTSAPNEERSGLGFSVMQSFMDNVKCTSKEGKGTTVILQKKLGI